MLEIAGVAVATFFATIGPIDVAAMFAAMTPDTSVAEKRSLAFRSTVIATLILTAFAWLGESILGSLGISLAALRTGGGILLLLIGIEMVFARTSGATTATEEETLEAKSKQDIAIFPLATPLIAGPGAMGAAILLMADHSGNIVNQLIVYGAMLAVLLIVLVTMLAAGQIQKLFGVTGMHVVSRVFGVILTALAVQFIFDGIAQSGLLNAAVS